MENKGNTKACCQLEAIVSFDERGQLVLPKDLRKKFNWKPGEKLALISCIEGEELCCITLMPAGKLQPMVKDVLGPVFENAL